MDAEFTPLPTQPNSQFNQHSMQTPSHLDIICAYYPSQQLSPSAVPMVTICKIGDETKRSHILNNPIPDAMYVHKSYLPSFPEFFSVSHQYQLDPFSTYFEIIPHPRFVTHGEAYMSTHDVNYLPVLDPRCFIPSRYQSEFDIPYLLIPDPRLVTPKIQYVLNPDFPWSTPTLSFAETTSTGGVHQLAKLPFGTQYIFARIARDLCTNFKLRKELISTFICVDCPARLCRQNSRRELFSHSRMDEKQLKKKSKKKGRVPNPGDKSSGSNLNY